MTFFTSGYLSHVYVYGNHRKYPTVFGKFRKCLKTVSSAFLDFLQFSKIFRRVRKSSKIFGNRFLSNIANFEYFFWKSTSGKPVRIRGFKARGPHTLFDRLRVNQSECRKLQAHMIIIDNSFSRRIFFLVLIQILLTCNMWNTATKP